ncbi:MULTISPECIES: glycoside hydrolase family 5 protein [Cellulomonas]|uniref:glycoside hydrolase family 5 protein n=1 Tax=Cellulomonas TaxID=1707 RepID=UPI0014562BD1|nr:MULTISPECIES: cellulase family glycosylhydrolase [Cellulomonas]
MSGRTTGVRDARARGRRALVVLAAVLALVGPLAVPASAADPSSGNVPAQRRATGEQRWGDGSYLDGHRYLRGVNVYSLIFGGSRGPGAVGESQRSYDFLAGRGVDVVRLPVAWGQLQPVPSRGGPRAGLDRPVSQEYLDVVETQVARAARAGIRTVIDLHNACSYPDWQATPGSLTCGSGITEDDVRRVWGTIARRFARDERVLAYDLFNETELRLGVEVYKRYTQVATQAIRAQGAEQTVWVQRMLGARGRLADIAPDGPWVRDHLGKVMYSQHFYLGPTDATFDPFAGNHAVLEDLQRFGDWCRRWRVRCVVGEVGWPSGGRGGVQSEASGRGWNLVFEQFYRSADAYGLDVTYFAASSHRRPATLLAYVASRPGYPSPSGLDTALSQARVIEAHPSRRAG